MIIMQQQLALQFTITLTEDRYIKQLNTMGIFDFLFGKRTNKDIEKWEKRRSIPPMGGTPIKKVPLKEGLKDDTANEPVKKSMPKKTYDKNDLENLLLNGGLGYKEEYEFIKTLRQKLLAGKISDENNLNQIITNHYMSFEGNEIMTKQMYCEQLEAIFAIYLEDFEKKKKYTTILQKKYDFTIPFEDAEQYHSLAQKIHGQLGGVLMQKLMDLTQ